MTPAAVMYGIVRSKDVREYIRELSASEALAVDDAILSLQDEPRPGGVEQEDISGVVLYLLNVQLDGTRYAIKYVVDDDKERVTIISIYEKRFS